MTPLRKRFIEDLQLRNRSPRTIDCYVGHLARFAQYFGRSPEQLGPEETRRYQLHLLEEGFSWSYFNQCVCALRFLYGTTLGRADYVARLPYGRRPKTLPVVLDRQEVLELLSCVRLRKHRLILTWQGHNHQGAFSQYGPLSLFARQNMRAPRAHVTV